MATQINLQVKNKETPKDQWDIAPADHEIYSMDHVRPMYRKAVEQYINVPNKTLMKKPFFTIATNVLGPDVHYSRRRVSMLSDDLVDIYLPLEIAITKWSIRDAKLKRKERKIETRCWVINPAAAVDYTVAQYSRLHFPKHKISFDTDIDKESPYVEDDWQKIGTEINSFLSQDRVVFSQSLRHIRQDLGSLKWLNHELIKLHNKGLKPISVLNIVDLYVLLIRKFNTDPDFMIGEAIANYRLNKGHCFHQCKFHKHLLEVDIETPNCAKALTIGKTNKLLNDMVTIGQLPLN